MAESKGGWESGNADSFAAAITSPIHRVYVNGFMNSASPTDIVSILLTNGQPGVVLNFSFSTVKTYATALLELVSNIEAATGQPILMAGEIETAVRKRSEAGTTQEEEV
jgi:hypothetical protein